MDKQKIYQGISLLYNKHHQTLTDDLKTVLIETAKTIEIRGNISLAAIRLNRFLELEIRYYKLGINAPKELVDLYNLTAKSGFDLFLGKTD